MSDRAWLVVTWDFIFFEQSAQLSEPITLDHNTDQALTTKVALDTIRQVESLIVP